MAAKKTVRRTQTRQRTATVAKVSVLADWWTTTPGIYAAAAFVVVVAVLGIAYRSSVSPAADPKAAQAETHLADVEQDVPQSALPDDVRPPATPAIEANAGRTAAASDTALVTITGCLERGDKQFRLKDTAGADAPKSRSWKSGFLTRRSSSVAIVAAPTDVRLSRHLGQRIAVTGTIADREMRVRSLRRVSASCEDGSRVKA